MAKSRATRRRTGSPKTPQRDTQVPVSASPNSERPSPNERICKKTRFHERTEAEMGRYVGSLAQEVENSAFWGRVPLFCAPQKAKPANEITGQSNSTATMQALPSQFLPPQDQESRVRQLSDMPRRPGSRGAPLLRSQRR